MVAPSKRRFAIDTTPENPLFPPARHPCAAMSGDRMLLRPFSILVILVATAGCRFLTGTAATTATVGASPRPAHQQARKTVQLELLFVRHDAQDAALSTDLWTHADEQFLEADVRDRLAANGLRVGIVGDHLAPHVASRLRADASTPSPESELATDAAISRRRLQLLPGRRGEIVTNGGVRELVLLERGTDGVTGATYRDATTIFSLEAAPAANGCVCITVTPEIKHGPLEKSWVGEDGMFRLETGQRRHRLEHLSFVATLPRDGMLVIGSVGNDSASVGDGLLTDCKNDGGRSVRLLAIRPQADTVDPLFTPGGGDDLPTDSSPLTIH